MILEVTNEKQIFSVKYKCLRKKLQIKAAASFSRFNRARIILYNRYNFKQKVDQIS